MRSNRFKILQNQLNEIETYFPFIEMKNTKISNSTVSWQLDHTLKVFIAVSESTKNSNPKEYEWKFNYWRLMLFPLNYIPRGKAKAPKYVLPPETINLEALKTQLQSAKNYIEILKTLSEKAYFKHFIFGKLSKKQTLRFLQMHTHHHLKIVRDILK